MGLAGLLLRCFLGRGFLASLGMTSALPLGGRFLASLGMTTIRSSGGKEAAAGKEFSRFARNRLAAAASFVPNYVVIPSERSERGISNKTLMINR